MSILDSRINRRAAGRVAVLAAALLAIALVSPLAALRGQETPSTQVPADVEATIRAAQTQKNYEMLDGPAAALITARQYELARKLLQSGAAIRQQVAGDNSVEYGIGVTKLADLQMKQNRFGDAESLYEKAVGAIGDRPEAYRPLIMLGVIMLHEKNRGAAMDYFQRAQRVNPSGAGPAWTWMAVAGRDDPAQAEASYNSALALEKADSGEAATTLELFADFLKAQARPTEAQPLSDRAKAIRTALAPARKTTAGVYKMGGSVTPPKILSKMEPEYTEEARLAKYQGTAVVYVEIGVDGVPRNIQIARGLGMGLDDNAVAAISNWRFQPASKDGARVPVMATIEVNFRLM